MAAAPAAAQTTPGESSFVLDSRELGGTDKLLHFGASAAIVDVTWAGLALLDAPLWQRVVGGVAVAAAAGLAKESADALGAGTPSWGDLVWNAYGIGAGVGFALVAESIARTLAVEVTP
jgi:hypothetical protein